MKRAAGGWLFKQEPGCYSYADLERDGETLWDGVANPQARQFLRSVQPGDRVLYYHTGKEKAVVGEMRVVAGPHVPAGDDARAVAVTVEPVKRWTQPVTLRQVKADDLLQGWELARLPRLSVMPVSAAQWRRLEQLRDQAKGVPSTPIGP